MDGSGSSDPDSSDLTYRWIAPEGIILNRLSSESPRVVFFAPDVGEDTVYTFKLVVNDGMMDSEESLVEVLVKHVNKAPVADAG